MQRILVAVDGSAAAQAAVGLAADLAGKYDAELVLVTVVSDLAPALVSSFGEYARMEGIQGPASEYAAGVAIAKSAIDEAEKAARDKGAARISTEMAFGDPAAEIVSAAKAREVDLVVVGSHGHGRLAGLVLGSVSQKVVSHAPCPVLVIR
jgi:nucleotide-binding universal stress UspA family protein